MSLDQYIRNLGAKEKTISMINIWVQVMHGVDSSEESAAFFIDYCRRNKGLFSIRADDKTGGNHQRILTGMFLCLHSSIYMLILEAGTTSFANGIADLIGHSHIHLGQPVASIEDLRHHVSVTTATGKTFEGRKAIISLPSAMYKSLNIQPPLPAAARDVYNSARLGHYNKCLVIYDRPWWRDLGYNGFFISYEGPSNLGRDTSVDEKGLWQLTCFVNGSNGEKWSKLYPHERRKAILDQLARIYDVGSDSEVYRPIEVFDQIWKHEPFSQGALAPITKIGHYVKYGDIYGKPVGNLHFVGTEYSKEWKGYMEGAVCSGEAGAKEVTEVLQATPRSRL